MSKPNAPAMRGISPAESISPKPSSACSLNSDSPAIRIVAVSYTHLIEDALEQDAEDTAAQADSEGSSETEEPDEPDMDAEEE